MKVLTAMLLTLLVSQTLMAQNQQSQRRGPPQEAIDACSGKSESDSCSFEGHQGRSVEGSCKTMREDFVCVPEFHQMQRGGNDERQQ